MCVYIDFLCFHMRSDQGGKTFDVTIAGISAT